MSKLHLIAAAIISCSIPGCGQKPEKPHVRVAPREARIEFENIQAPHLVSSTENEHLLGSWTTSCLQISEESSLMVEIDINEKFYIYKMINFEEANCRSEFYRSRFISTYTASSDSLISSLYQTNIMIKDAALADASGRSQSCGYSFWRPNVWYDLSDRYCNEGAEGVAISPTIKGTKTEFSYEILNEQGSDVLAFDSFRFKRHM